MLKKEKIMNSTNNMFSSFWADNDWDTRRTDLLGDYYKPKKRQVVHIQLAQLSFSSQIG